MPMSIRTFISSNWVRRSRPRCEFSAESPGGAPAPSTLVLEVRDFVCVRGTLPLALASRPGLSLRGGSLGPPVDDATAPTHTRTHTRTRHKLAHRTHGLALGLAWCTDVQLVWGWVAEVITCGLSAPLERSTSMSPSVIRLGGTGRCLAAVGSTKFDESHNATNWVPGSAPVGMATRCCRPCEWIHHGMRVDVHQQ